MGFCSFPLLHSRPGEMVSGGEGERMRVDLEGDRLLSQNIPGDVSVLFVIIFVFFFFRYSTYFHVRFSA